MRRNRKHENGQATVELALVVPILIWLLVGLVDVARMANAYLIIGHAAREAVRLGITGAPDADVTERVREATATLDQGRLNIRITPQGERDTGTDITIAIDYRYEMLALMGIVDAEVPLQTQLTSRVE